MFVARFIGLGRNDVVWVIGVEGIGRRGEDKKIERKKTRLWSSLKKNTSLALFRRATREKILHVHLIEEMRGRKLEASFRAKI